MQLDMDNNKPSPPHWDKVVEKYMKDMHRRQEEGEATRGNDGKTNIPLLAKG